MYNALILLLLGAAAFLVYRGVIHRHGRFLIAGLTLLAAVPLFFTGMTIWGEWLWFESLGYAKRFQTAILAGIATAVTAGILSALIIALLTRPLNRGDGSRRYWPESLGLLYGVLWGAEQWSTVLKWWLRSDTGITDPILGRDVSFYLFALPFYDALYWLAAVTTVLACVTALARRLATFPRKLRTLLPRELQRRFARGDDWSDDTIGRGPKSFDAGELVSWREPPGSYGPLALSAGAFALVLAAGAVLDAFHLMYSEYGTVTGAGWTDVRIRLPAYALAAVITALAGGWLMYWAFQANRTSAEQASSRSHQRIGVVFGLPVAVVVAFRVLGLGVVPTLTQWLWVSPNEITVERPYIEHNIQFTRHAFALDRIEGREFSVSEELPQQAIDNNQQLLSNIRLWDPRALLATYEQFQEIRLYYEFSDVDIDRYQIGSDYRQVMISPREIELDNLPEQSQTFVNRRFKYTHGFGLTLAPVSDFTPEGLPNLLIKDLPPQSRVPELQVARPEIYYGEHTTEHAVVNTQEPEFNYPSGDKNVYTRYAGTGGVLLNSLWRKFVFGWKFDGTRFFFSGYPTDESRVQFHRAIHERVRTLAPFLTFDRDPYFVLHEGNLYWIVDAYTTSTRYPYSARLERSDLMNQFQGANYLRNAVKAVVNAYNGDVNFYIFEPDDPMIQVWDRIYPGLLQPSEQMPDGLRTHIRYPEGLLSAQGAVYSKYHMTNPEVFYNQEDLWVQATEKYYADVQPVDPYYVMWEPPESDAAEFILMQPFTPKNRQVMISWIAGMCDGENYGRLLAYRFPKETRVLGPQQVETKIDQDRNLSGQLTLWDQRGSRVIRGNLLTIPVNDTLLYVEPIYLQAEAAAYPELRLVAVMHDDRLSYANTFDEALRGLLNEPQPAEPAPRAPETGPSGQTLPSELVRRANDAFQEYVRLTGEQEFGKAAEELERLRAALEDLLRESKADEEQ